MKLRKPPRPVKLVVLAAIALSAALVIPSPADNDDYIVVADICSEGDGVKAWAWLNGKCLESCAGRYVHGVGATSYWDSFPNGEVKKGDYVGLKVCSVDGNSGPPYNCLSHTGYSDDG